MMFPHKIAGLVVSAMLIYNYFFTTPLEVGIRNPQFGLLGPYNATEPSQIVDDVYEQLIDLKNFTFIVNPQPCHNYSAGLLLVIIISSNPSHYNHRTVIRNTWGRSTDSTKVVFLMGESENVTISHRIDNESAIFGDIVQGSFTDDYRNMTYKHVMGLKWVAHHCPTAKYVLKTDDDVVVNSHGLRQFLARQLSPWGAKGLIICEVFEHALVRRSNESKWRVSPTEYGPDYYPTYCAGWAILYSQDVVLRLLQSVQLIPYFWIDDVQVTGVVAQHIGVARNPLDSLVLSWDRATMLTSLGADYAGKFLFGPPHISVSNISQIWKAFPK